MKNEIKKNLENSILYLEQRNWCPDALKSAAGISYWSKEHLCRVFRIHQGQSLGRYMRNKRLNLAANRLLNSNQSVTEILYELNFNSHQSFTRTFSNHFGVPPTIYRQNTSIKLSNSNHSQNYQF